MNRLEGKSAIVTGAADGIGLAIARRFAEYGANLVMVDSNAAKLEEEAEILREEGYPVVIFTNNLKKKLDIKNLIATTAQNYEQIDILANASLQICGGDPLSFSDDSFLKLLQENVLQNFEITRVVAGKMIDLAEKRQITDFSGSIINLSSIAASRTVPELTSYSVSTAALNQLTKSMAVTLAKHNIRVNSVAIGSVMSANLQSALRDYAHLRDQLIGVTPLRRIGDASEVAETFSFLASDESSFITGQILDVDGGRSILDPLQTPSY